MKYANREMKIDQIIGYFNHKKINLLPPFQRGTVWSLTLRKKLIENMVESRPIPAVFLYKQVAGDQFEYNILDGKQRLESLILFIGNRRAGMKVDNVHQYFTGKPALSDVNFSIDLQGKKVSFAKLDSDLVRALGEYPIPTIEIDLDDESANFAEVVNLFIDINQYGMKVTRFDVVKALGKDPLFRQVFGLVAKREDRKRTSYYKLLNNSYVTVMSKLNIISKLSDNNSQVDRMWERMTEIALFSRSKQHRAPAGVLKSFIHTNAKQNLKLDSGELTRLRIVFGFLATAYEQYPALAKTKFATDQPQFYTLVTTLLSTTIMDKYPDLARRILAVAQMVDGKKAVPDKLQHAIEEYKKASAKQTTNPNRRASRHAFLMEALGQV